MSELAVLSAGAAQAAVCALAGLKGFELRAEFGAVGAMQKKLREGAPCDVIVLTRALIDELAASGRVTSSAALGSVRTAIAVRDGDPLPDVSSEAALRAALLAAEEIYFPDPEKATAGIHFAKVLGQLDVEGRRRTFPNGATAMREMVRAPAKRVMGCTQATEIMNTPGARLVAPLPAGFELATSYAAGVCADAPHGELARRFLALLGGSESRELRLKAGFEL